MKILNTLLSLFFFLFLISCSKKSKKISTEKHKLDTIVVAQKIHLSISNIPKIQFKFSTGINSYKIDKRPTITYRLFNDAIDYEIKYDTITKSQNTSFDKDTIFLKLRYNPGKSKTFILQRGDSAFINYIDNKPILILKNRGQKKHDIDVTNAILKYDNSDAAFSYLFNPLQKNNFKKETQRRIKSYSKILGTLDSLKQLDFISNAEYYYYKKKYKYKKARLENKIEVEELKNEDLHLDAHIDYLRKYVFMNLKKKTVSLGNGLSRNFLESFDFVLKNEVLSNSNKKVLLQKNLREIKKDYPKSVYEDRVEKFSELFPEDVFEKEKKKSIPNIQKELRDVLLMNAANETFSLSQVLQQFKGKIIYVDFWASWCAPCRAAFPSYDSLKKKFKEEDIVFIFISGDRDETKWRKAAKEEKLVHSFLATNYPEAIFYKKLLLNSFPRYLVFNKNGELINDKAKAPDSDLIYGFLDELIEKK